jgi:hypothetical protein
VTPILARIQHPPSRGLAAALTFGAILGLPAFFGLSGIAFAALDADALSIAAFVVAALAFFAGTVTTWTFIITAKSRLVRAEQALYAGDFEGATQAASFVMRTVFRADFQTGALYTLALSAEHMGAFREAGELFARVLDAVPMMAAQGPGRRARALAAAHGALDFAAAYDHVRAAAMLARCYHELGTSPGGGFSIFRLDDSGLGLAGINSILTDLERRRDPRPIAVLAAALVVSRNGDARGAADLLMRERASVEQGLAPHERALADRLFLVASQGAVRAPASEQHPWVAAILP